MLFNNQKKRIHANVQEKKAASYRIQSNSLILSFASFADRMQRNTTNHFRGNGCECQRKRYLRRQSLVGC